ncbi:DUF2312 domain-containing protein [Corticibacterium sp. UT-5YL-CI-8]|nr:DUF2312 domain-containing protein [Tianweitania sp. UT-5YL-CI-8]
MNDHNPETSQTVSAGQLRAYIERIENREEAKKEVSDEIKDIYAELKGAGYEPKAIRTIVALRKKDANERAEEETILELYKSAIGMA